VDKNQFQDLDPRIISTFIITINSLYITILLIFLPLIIISPDIGFRSLINIRNVVVLPAPFAPKILTLTAMKK
jgi:hypothetical protein